MLDHRNKVSRQLFAPLEYYFDFSNKCNLRCPHCYNSKHLGKITMPEESVSAIIDEMYDLGVMRLHLAGGEPTIEKKGIANYLSTAKKHNIVTSMATNGTLLTDEMCEILLGNDMFAISISLDGYDEETNNKRRGEGFFSVTVDGVRRLIKKRDEMGKKTEICLKPIYEYNTSLNFFDRMTEFAISLGVDKIKFSNPERSVNHELGYYEEHDCIVAEKKENKQLNRIMEFADNNNLIPMKIFRRGIFGRRLSDEVFYKAVRYMRAGKADALVVTNLDAISDGVADSYLKVGIVREAGFRLFSVDEKEPKLYLYEPPKRGDIQ